MQEDILSLREVLVRLGNPPPEGKSTGGLDKATLKAKERLINLLSEKGTVKRESAQYIYRRRKIQENKVGKERSWLLCNVAPIRDAMDADPVEWLRGILKDVSESLPNSAYKIMILYMLESADEGWFTRDGTVRFPTAEGLQIFIMPAMGKICFRAPSGSLKAKLEESDYACEWNWAFGAAFYDSADGSVAAPGDGMSEHLRTEISRLHSEIGTGKSSVITIIDSGICANSRELQGRVVKQFQIKPHPGGGFQWSDDGLVEEAFSHGTQVASLAAGSTIGVAPEAGILSFALPVREDGKFDQFSLYYALELILSKFGPTVEGKRIVEITSTLLMSNGVLLQNKLAPEFANDTKATLGKLHEDYDIVVVAAVGNQAARVAFPASFPFVFSVGSLDLSGKRLPISGYGADALGDALPNCHVVGEKVYCEGAGGQYLFGTGTSFSAALLAGIFTILAHKKPSSQARWAQVKAAINKQTDECGDLPILDLSRIIA